MNTPKIEAIENKKAYTLKQKDALEKLGELLAKLRTHTGKLVDKRFFVEHFKVSNEYRDWTRFEIRAPRYDWSKHSNELYISQECTLELDSRETAHIIAKAEEMEQRLKDGIARYTAEIEALESFDENALIADLRALYVKYGAPETWQKVLDSYEVKYPSND